MNMKRGKEMHILFVCKYNRFRSKLADAFFKKINKNKNIKSKSAGLFKGSPIDEDEKATAKENGIRIRGKPIGISTKLLKWQDIIVIMADNVPKENFQENEKYGKKVIVFKIKDSDSKEDNSRVVKEIKKAVEELNEMLKKS
jgi:protein-tyrosine-phosphatase